MSGFTDIADIYELTPMQQGMLYHCLGAPASERVHFVQISYTWRGPMDAAAFARAWRATVARHAVLRTSFMWEGLEKPLQVVRREAELSIETRDLRGVAPAERNAALEDYLAEDRRRGFSLDEAPLMRVAALRLADETYRVVWSFHHLLFEGWSASLIHAELANIYEALRRGQTPALAPPRPFRDYVLWLQRKDLGPAEDYWRATLDGFTAPTPLGVDRTHATDDTTEPATGEERVWLAVETYAALQTFARRHRLTPNVVAQGAWSLVLAAYSGESDVVFGTVVSGRQAAPQGAESIVGLFINTLPTRVRLAPDAPLLDWLRTLQAQQLEMLQHEYSSLIDVQGWSQIRRGTPLFESLFVFENWIGDASRGGAQHSFTIGDFEQFDGGPGYPLAVVVEPGRDCLLKAIYNRGRFAATTVARMLGHLLTLLDAFTRDPERRLCELSPLTTHERHQLLVEWNDTRTSFAREGLPRLFARHVSARPDAIAVVCGDEHLTYGELDARANQAAHALHGFGVGPETRVGLCVERSTATLIGLLAILKAGGAYVPLDPAYPLERLALMAEEAQLGVIVTRKDESEKLPAFWGQVLCLDADDELLEGQRRDDPRVEVGPDNLAYVSFTSGSTGRPKGVEVRHAGVARLVDGARFATLDENQRLLHLSPLAFDASTLEVWGALLRGGCCVLLPERVAEPHLLGRTLRQQQVTTLWLTASLFNLVTDEAPAALRGVGQLLVGGEALSAPHVRKALANLPNTQVVNGYGPTEATTFACCYPLRGDWRADETSVPIGRPIGETRAYVLDYAMRPVPSGVAGELYVGGEGLARGYLNRPDLTAERFVPDPFGEPGERLYRTGDLVRQRPDGRVEFLGRLDHQVKVRGFRIELGEVEAALGQCPGVRQAAAVVREDTPGDKRLVAYVVMEPGADCSPGRLRELLQRSLPEYMLPTAFATLDALPLKSSGKVDRKALPAPETTAAVGDDFVVPRTPVEELLAGIWCQVLGVERVGVNDDFFELGGHSLRATQVVSQVRELFRVEVSLRQFFESPTVEGVAAAVEQARREQAGRQRPPVAPSRGDEASPLSFAQQRLWFIEQLLHGRPLYHIPVALRLDGLLSLAAFEQCFDEVVRRHEVLRTRIADEDGRPVQLVGAPRRLAPPLVDLSGLGPAEAERVARETCARLARRPMNLGGGHVLHFCILRTTTERHLAALVMHHIVTDGWSNGVLAEEVGRLYGAYTAGRPSPLAELEVQYADFAVWQRRWLDGETLREQTEYWRRQLADAPRVLELPTDRPRPAQPTYEGAQHTTLLPASLAHALRRLGREEGVTLFMTLMTGLQTLLYRYTGQEDICVGTPIANRNQAETERLIGFFVNTLVMRARIAQGMSFADLLAQVRESSLGAYANQDVPFELLVETLQPDRLWNYTPLFQVVLAVQNTPATRLALEGLAVSPLDLATRTSKFDLTIDIKEIEDGLAVVVEYATDIFEAVTVARMARHLEALLAEAADDPRCRLTDLRLLTEAERQQLLVEWADTGRDYPRELSLAELFETQTAATPDAVAVVYDGSELTYGELDARASRLASRLRAHGVGEEAAVVLCTERSLEMVVGMIAVLKAGGVYVPLDASYPRERRDFMLADSGARVVLTQEKFAAEMAAHGVPLITLDGDDASLVRDRATVVGGARLAYVMYTSGSTGRPKGVCITHRAVARLVKNTDYVSLGPGETLLQFAPISFDASTLEIWGSLLNGARLVVYPRAGASLEEVGRELKREQVTTLWLTAGLFHQMAEYRVEDLASLRQLLAGGEALSVPHVRRVMDEAARVQLINGYGPTENTTFTCCHRVGRADEPGTSVPIGRPITNTRAHLLDPNFQTVPAGVPGELYAGGDGLARGYLNRPDLTAERFTPDPDPSRPGERIYRTGDLARYRHDGTIEFLGRLDYQVKLRGFRLEPDEIAFALKEHEAVGEAVVVAREDEAGDKQLVAYVVSCDVDGACDVDAAELRRHLKGRLPGYMMPSAFVLLEQLPLTANGKVDRRRLPAPEAETSAAGFVAPRTPVEELLAGVWCQVLGVERVGVNDNFFELGGHSLRATQVVSRVRERLRLELPLRAFFEGPTVAELAACVEAGWRAGLDDDAPALVPVARDAALPLSFAQQRLLALETLLPGQTVYNIPAAVRLSGRLNAAALRQSFNEIVRRHEVLRASFVERKGQSAQQVEPPFELSVPIIDLSGLAADERERARASFVERERRRLFDLRRGPLLRVALFRLSPREHVALLVMHHIVTDGWSVGVLVRELGSLYEAFAAGRPSPLAELEVQYADFAVWQRAAMSDEVLAPQLDYWRGQLKDAPHRLRLRDATTHTSSAIRCASRRVRLSRELRDALEELSRREGVTLFMTLLAAYQTLLYRHTGQARIPVGVPVANRRRAEAEALVGFFVNMLVLCTETGDDPTFRELLGRVRETALSAYANQDVPFERLVGALRQERYAGRAPLVQATFTFHNAPMGVLRLPDVTLTPVELEGAEVEYDLSLILKEDEDGLGGVLVYNADYLDDARAERLMEHFNSILTHAVAAPDTRLLDLELPGQVGAAALVEVHPDDAAGEFVFEAEARQTPA